MTARSTRPDGRVTAVLVTHDGAAWLPETLAGLAEQQRRPDAVVVVDTGSVDASLELVAPVADQLVTLPREASYGQAIRAALQGCAAATEGEWLWLLHDDCAPDPGALAALLETAAEMPSAGVVGPKCLSWDGRHLIEVGITTDATGRRETGLERHEVDHGQHDAVRDVLAVGTAGALVRRSLFERLGGFDPALPTARDDIDFGWRVNRAGARVVVAPRAVVRHASAGATGVRAPGVPGRAHRLERRAALWTLLVNVPGAALVLGLPRVVVGTLLRALGLLLARRSGDALDELAALGWVLRRPATLRAARRARRATAEVPHAGVRPLLAGPSARLRSYREAVSGLARRSVAPDLPRQRRAVPVESGPVAEEAEDYDTRGDGLVRYLLTRPPVVLVVALAVVSLLAFRHLLGGTVWGGTLLPPPAGAADLWHTYTSGWHPVSTGSAATAPPSLALLALLSTVLLGKPWLAVEVLLVGAVPLAGLTAYLAAGALTRDRRVRLWAGAGYALLPALSAALATGRVDVAVAVALLPTLAAAITWTLRREPAGRGRHAPAATGLLLTVVVAFVPVTWLVAAAALVVGTAVARIPRRLLSAVVVLAVPALLLLPWSADVARHPALLLGGLGRPLDATAAPAHAFLLASPGGPGTPWPWLALPLVLAALVAVSRLGRSGPALAAWVLVLAGVGLGLGLQSQVLVTPWGERTVAWPGIAAALAGLGLVLGVVVAADGAREALVRRNFGWRQPAAALLALTVGAAPLAMAGSWVVRGAGDPLHGDAAPVAPAFVAADLASADQPRLLMLRGSGIGVDYLLERGADGPRLGDVDLARSGVARSRLTALVRRLVAGSGEDVAAGLATFGVRYVIARDLAPAISARLDATDGLSRRPSDVVGLWRVTAPAARLALRDPAAAQVALAGRTPSAVATPLPSGPVTARTRVPAGSAGRLVVLAEPADGRWTATLDGVRLPGRTAYGWAQAFELPPSGGELRLARDEGHRALWLWLQAGLTLLVVVLAVPAPSRRGEPVRGTDPGQQPEPQDAPPVLTGGGA